MIPSMPKTFSRIERADAIFFVVLITVVAVEGRGERVQVLVCCTRVRVCFGGLITVCVLLIARIKKKGGGR